MKKIIVGGCLAVVLLVILISAGIAYTVSRAASGALKPKDLGIRATAEQAKAAQDKTTVKVFSLPPETPLSQSIRFEGSKPVSYSMDSTELTALAIRHGQYKYFPFHNVQIRVNQDNSVEISGVADTSKAISYATAIGFAPADVEKALEQYNIPRSSVTFYVKGSGSVTNGKVALDLNGGSIAGIPVPMSLVNPRKQEIINILETGMRKTPGFEAKSIKFSDGKVHFDGSLAEREYSVQ